MLVTATFLSIIYQMDSYRVCKADADWCTDRSASQDMPTVPHTRGRYLTISASIFHNSCKFSRRWGSLHDVANRQRRIVLACDIAGKFTEVEAVKSLLAIATLPAACKMEHESIMGPSFTLTHFSHHTAHLFIYSNYVSDTDSSLAKLRMADRISFSTKTHCDTIGLLRNGLWPSMHSTVTRS